MHKLIAVLSSFALVVSTGAPGQARVESRIRVDGDNAAQGLRLKSASCEDPGTIGESAAFDLGVVPSQGAPLGSHVIQWTPTTEKSARGPVARVEDPRSLSALSLRALGPLEDGSGVAFARYSPTGTSGYWEGLADLDLPDGDGWQRIDAAGASYDWQHVVNGALEGKKQGGKTLQEFAAVNGPGPAWVGFGFGCKAAPVKMDALRVATDTEDRTYDFEGYATTSSIRFPGTTKARTSVRFGHTVRLRLGVRSAVDRTTRPGGVVVRGKPQGGKRYATIRQLSLDSTGSRWMSYSPRRSMIVRSRYVANGSHESSMSRRVLIAVRSVVAIHVNDRTVRQGERLVFRGRHRPVRRAKMTLQVQRGKRWVTVRRATSSGAGKYRLTTRSDRVGRSTWRVVARSGSGLATGVSSKVRVTTRARPAPAPSSPPSSGGTSGSGSGSTPSGGGTSGGGSGGGSEPPPPPPGGFRPGA